MISTILGALGKAISIIVKVAKPIGKIVSATIAAAPKLAAAIAIKAGANAATVLKVSNIAKLGTLMATNVGIQVATKSWPDQVREPIRHLTNLYVVKSLL